MHRKLKKTQKSLPPFGWDTEPVLGGEEVVEEAFVDVGGMSWCEKVLAVGLGDGVITLYDIRQQDPIGRIESHRDKVHGLRWRHDGNFLASSDQQGVVQVWDARASKNLTADFRYRSKMKHHAPVKVCIPLSMPQPVRSL